MQKNEKVISVKSRCPSIPEWLTKVQAKLAKGQLQNTTLEAIHYGFTNAEAGSKNSAEQIAIGFETGEFPCGIDIIEAIVWHSYAATLGSIKSGLRAAQLMYKKNARIYKTEIQEILDSCIINNMDKGISNRNRDFDSAAMAAKNIIQMNTGNLFGDVVFSQVKKLLEFEDFKKNQFYDEIFMLFESLRPKVESNLSLKVALRKIPTDGDFNVGIYKVLEKPLPLVSSPANPESIKATLDAEFEWFAEVNEIIYRQMVTSLMSASPAFKLRPMLLVGAPGIGKTTFVARLTELVKVPSLTLMAAGVMDCMFIKGLARGWGSSRPSALAQMIATEECASGLVAIDELEKASESTHNGRLWDALLQLLEPSTSKRFLDECLQVPLDFSGLSFIATANELGRLPKPLLERFMIIHMQAPGKEHLGAILDGVISRYAKELGFEDVRMLPELDRNDHEILGFCKSPREINRTARLMMEKKLVESRKLKMN